MLHKLLLVTFRFTFTGFRFGSAADLWTCSSFFFSVLVACFIPTRTVSCVQQEHQEHVSDQPNICGKWSKEMTRQNKFSNFLKTCMSKFFCHCSQNCSRRWIISYFHMRQKPCCDLTFVHLSTNVSFQPLQMKMVLQQNVQKSKWKIFSRTFVSVLPIIASVTELKYLFFSLVLMSRLAIGFFRPWSQGLKPFSPEVHRYNSAN